LCKCEFSSVDEDVYNDILFDKHWKDIYMDVSSIKSELITKMREGKYFVVTPYGSNSAGQRYLYVYKDFGILYTRTFNPNWYRDESQSFIHNLPNHILFVLKYAQNIEHLLDMYKTNPEYFNQNYNTSYNICKSKINIMVENRSNEIAETKIKELITIILYSFTLVFIIIIFSIIIFNYIYKKQREIIFYEI